MNKKLVLMYTIVAFIIVLFGSFIIIGVLNLDGNDDEEIKTTTTNNDMSVSTTSSLENTTNTTNTTNSILTTTTTATNIKSTSSTTTKKTTTTTKKKTTSKTRTTTTTENPSMPGYTERETTDSNSTYPNALDSWEWEIVDAINRERKNNGLEELRVATDLRRLAEEAADYWQDYSDEELGNYLEGYSHYGYKSNVLDSLKGYESLYNATVQNTRVTTNKYLRYLGVGVIYKSRGISGLKTYYYIIIYE